MAAALVVAGGIAGAAPAAAADAVVFADADLRAAVNAQLGKPAATPVTPAAAAALTWLYADAANIDSLGGIEAFTGLSQLSLTGNRVSDISPLGGLTALTTLYLGGNRIVDTRPLAPLPNLDYADVSAQAVSLAAIRTTQTQENPLRAPAGTPVIPSSATATIAGDGASWQLPTAGTHTLDWSSDSVLAGGGWVSFGGTITQKSSSTGVIEITATPTISGSVRVGGVLTAAAGTWDLGVVFSYQWLANGTPVAGADQRTMTLAKAQEGARISVRVTGSRPEFTPVTKTSAQTGRVILAAVPKISGTVRLGKTLTAKPGTWTTGTTLAYQWYADGRTIPGATTSTLVLRTSQQGMTLTVKVTGKKSGYAGAALTSAASAEMRMVDTSTKASVTALYKSLASRMKVATGWTGKTSSCKVGTESSKSKLATMDAVNFFRALNQLDGVRFTSTWNTQALRNSLMMQARGQITHYPSKSGKCWSTAAAAAAKTSNLAIASGYSSSVNPSTGARAIAGYMRDEGASNIMAGHRRWILEPTTTVMGTGSTTTANTLKVMGTSTSSTMAKPTWMEWPSAGYFPKQLEPKGLWSLSASSAAVDFSKAKVKVVGANGKTYKASLYPVQNGYGPNTLTWRVSGLSLPKGKTVTAYSVTVSGIKGAAVTSYTYTVRMFDPYG